MASKYDFELGPDSGSKPNRSTSNKTIQTATTTKSSYDFVLGPDPVKKQPEKKAQKSTEPTQGKTVLMQKQVDTKSLSNKLSKVSTDAMFDNAGKALNAVPQKSIKPQSLSDMQKATALSKKLSNNPGEASQHYESKVDQINQPIKSAEEKISQKVVGTALKVIDAPRNSIANTFKNSQYGKGMQFEKHEVPITDFNKDKNGKFAYNPKPYQNPVTSLIKGATGEQEADPLEMFGYSKKDIENLKKNNPYLHGLSEIALGAFQDPTSYIGAGVIKDIGVAALKKIPIEATNKLLNALSKGEKIASADKIVSRPDIMSQMLENGHTTIDNLAKSTGMTKEAIQDVLEKEVKNINETNSVNDILKNAKPVNQKLQVKPVSEIINQDKEIVPVGEPMAKPESVKVAAIENAAEPDEKVLKAEPKIEKPAKNSSTVPMSERSIVAGTEGNVGNKKVKSYQFEHPEVKDNIQSQANYILKHEFPSVKNDIEPTTQVMKDLKDSTKATYAEIKDGLESIVNDHGAENTPVAKRIEMVIDKHLTNGFDSVYGEHFPADADYLAKKSKIEKVNAPESIKSEDLPVGNINSFAEPKTLGKAPTNAKEEIFIKSAADILPDDEKELNKVIKTMQHKIESSTDEAEKYKLNLQLFAADKKLQEISEFRTNTIERSALLQDAKEFLPEDEFGYDKESVVQWKNEAANNLSVNPELVKSKIKKSTQLSSVQEYESALISADLYKKAKETGDYS
ncbi:MAG: hypothetical protein Q8876_09135, partial [Bacillota bacterium]|nr:hypothetical protein [Bacillota bacterium]